jgi:hypothetical protein
MIYRGLVIMLLMRVVVAVLLLLLLLMVVVVVVVAVFMGGCRCRRGGRIRVKGWDFKIRQMLFHITVVG